MTRLLLIGPPGAGKGTQGARLAERFAIPAVSTGDIFRANVAQATELGKQAKAYMDRGAYVPDELTNALVLDRLQQPDAAGGFLLDGFPRTLAQVETLDAFFAEQGIGFDAVVQLLADEDEVVRRLLNRAAEQGRADDTEAVIRHRLAVYAEQTAPLVALYADRGLLVSIDGLGAPDEVFARILEGITRKVG